MGIPRICVIVALAVSALGCRQVFGFETPGLAGDASADAPQVVIDAPPIDVAVEGWAFRKPITIVGDQVEAPLANFPVLIKIAADADLAANARMDGFDLVFTAADGTTKLDHERERYDPTTGGLVAWVRMPALSDTADTTFYLLFGNPTAMDQQTATAVWDSDFVGVWHFGETSGTSVADSTSNGRTGTKTSASTPAPVSGAIGGAQMYAGGADGVAIGNANALDIANITFETWIAASSCANDVYRRIVDFPLAFTNHWVVAYPCSGSPTVNQRAIVVQLPNGTQLQTGISSFSANAPHHLVFQSDPATIWIDGTQRAMTGAPFGLAQNNTNVVIGNREGSPDRAVLGTMDEVRISRVRRSDAWIVTSHRNQRQSSTFLDVGPVEPVP